MQKSVGIIFIVFFYFMSVVSSAETQHFDDGNNGFISFQIIQDQIRFDNSNIKNASIIEENGVFKGLEIELKNVAVENFQNITKAGLNKTLNVVLNNKIISSTIIQTPLNQKILISGLTKGEAFTFINALRYNTLNKPAMGSNINKIES